MIAAAHGNHMKKKEGDKLIQKNRDEPNYVALLEQKTATTTTTTTVTVTEVASTTTTPTSTATKSLTATATT